MTISLNLLRHLLDGKFHSGERLGSLLGVSRSAIWKGLQGLKDQGVTIHAVRGRGYRIPHALELLEQDLIMEGLRPLTATVSFRMEVLLDIDSTNTYLRQTVPLGSNDVVACLAERQTQGRGRRGRQWVSPFAQNLYLSISYPLAVPLEALGGLSLSMGVAVNTALQEAGLSSAGLKWPNDVYWQQQKLAGILIEIDGESSGPCRAVVGVGINFDMRDADTAAIDQVWTDLVRAMASEGREPPSRNSLAGIVLRCLVQGLETFEKNGFSAVHDEWKRWDLCDGRPVMLRIASQEIVGLGRGVDEHGALLLETEGAIRSYHAGEVSLRLCP